MARSYGRITTDIWRDTKFRSLSGDAQRAYFVLCTQPDITATGLLPYTLRRWAAYASDGTVDALSNALSELASKRFVVIDEDTEELLVRSFAKWDGGIANRNRRPVVIEAAEAIVSQRIRAVMAVELQELGVTDALSDALCHAPTDAPMDGPSASDRVVVTEGEYVPQPLNHNPQPTTSTPVDDATRTVVVEVESPTAQTIVAEWIEHAPKRPPGQVIGQASKSIAAMLAEGIDPDDVRRGLAAWMAKGLHPSTLPSVVNEVMNSGGGGRPAAKRTTDDRVRDGLNLARRLAMQESVPLAIGPS